MDVNKLVEVLQATLQPNQREEAERQLNEVKNNAVYCDTIFLIQNGFHGKVRRSPHSFSIYAQSASVPFIRSDPLFVFAENPNLLRSVRIWF